MKGIYLTLVLLFCGAFTVIGQHNVRIMISLDPKAIIVNRSLEKGVTGISSIDKVSIKHQIQSIVKLFTGKKSQRNILLLQFDDVFTRLNVLVAKTMNTDFILGSYWCTSNAARIDYEKKSSVYTLIKWPYIYSISQMH